MELQNRTVLRAEAARTMLQNDTGILSVVVETDYRIDGATLRPLPEGARPARPSDPPEQIRYPLWFEVSVTAAGTVTPTTRPPHARVVRLSVSEHRCSLAVYGDRQWERFLGSVGPSAAAPIENISLSFARAFGGGYDVPPGVVPGTDMPHPGGRMMVVENPDGVGFYASEADAIGKPLPNFERPDARIAHVSDHPRPAGMSPSPDLLALRDVTPPPDAFLAQRARGRETDAELAMRLGKPFRAHHHAPAELIVPRVEPGETVKLLGVGPGPIEFTVPPAPTRVVTRLGRDEGSAPGVIRSLHVDADAMTATIVHAHVFTWRGMRMPAWSRVTATR